MTKGEAAKYVKEWVEYVEDPYAIPAVDQPCTEEGTKRFLHKEENGFAWEFKVAED